MSRKEIIIDTNIYWVNKEGKKLLVNDITDVKYLQNIVKFLIKKKNKDDYYDFMDMGDMQDCF